jgi:hypothetical protein
MASAAFTAAPRALCTASSARTRSAAEASFRRVTSATRVSFRRVSSWLLRLGRPQEPGRHPTRAEDRPRERARAPRRVVTHRRDAHTDATALEHDVNLTV